jgi:hypothetical protein
MSSVIKSEALAGAAFNEGAGKETEHSESKRSKNNIKDIQQTALQQFIQLSQDKKLCELSCMISEIPDLDIWCALRSHLLAKKRFNERDADLLCVIQYKGKTKDMPTNVFHAMRDQMMKETIRLLQLAHEHIPFVWMKLKTINEETVLLLIEVSLLISADDLSKGQQAPLIITDR